METFTGKGYDIRDSLRKVGVSEGDIEAIIRNARHLDAIIQEEVEKEIERRRDGA